MISASFVRVQIISTQEVLYWHARYSCSRDHGVQKCFCTYARRWLLYGCIISHLFHPFPLLQNLRICVNPAPHTQTIYPFVISRAGSRFGIFSSMFFVSPILLSVPLRLMLNLLSTRLAGFCVSDTVPRFGMAKSWPHRGGIRSRTVAKLDNTHTRK